MNQPQEKSGVSRLFTVLLPLIAGCFLSPSGALSQPSSLSVAEQRHIADAERLDQEGEVSEALIAYESFLRQFPSSEFSAEARLRLAWGRWNEGDGDTATRLAQELVDGYIDRAQAAGGFALLGEALAATAEDREAVDKARDILRNAWALFGRGSFPVLEWRTKALVKSSDLAFGLGEYEHAAAGYLAVIEDEPESSLTQTARLKLGESMLRLGEISAAARLFQDVIDSGDARNSGGSPAVATALRRNSLIYRLWLRPAAGSRPWSTARLLTVSGTILKKPEGVAASSDGRLIIADSGLRQVILLDGDGNTTSKHSTEDPQRPTFGSAGAPISLTGERVLDVEMRSSHSFGDPESKRGESLRKIRAAEQSRFGAWTILTSKPAQALSYDSSQKFRSTVFDKQRGDAVDLAHDEKGQVYLLDGKNRAVLRLPSGGASVERVIGGGWSKAAALDIDLLGNIYVLDQGELRIHIYDSDGKRFETLGPTLPGGITLKGAEDLTVDGAGKIYIADPRLSAVIVVE